MSIIDTEKIQELIDSDLSAYEIGKRISISRTTIVEIRNGKKDIESLSLKNAKKLQNFWEEYKMTKKFFEGNYDTVELEGNEIEKIRQTREAIEALTSSLELTEEIKDELYDVASNMSKEALRDSEHLYLSFEDIAPDVEDFDEIPTGGETDNGFESVVKYTQVELNENKMLYILFTYDI